MSASRAPQRGFSLVELVMGIAVLGIVLAGAVTLFFNLARHSADPMIERQALLIAEAYLDEILIKRFYDVDKATPTVCTGTTGGETRASFDNVCDYDGLNEAPRNQFGTAIAALASYNVVVAVANSGVTLNGINNTTNVSVLRVDVTVTGPGNTSVTLSAYRTNYECGTAGGTECKPI